MAEVGFEAMLLAAARCEAALADVLRPHDLGIAEWRTLRALYAAGPAAPSALAERLAMTRGGMTRVVTRLRARRLLVRAGAGQADQRFQTVALTGGGAMLVAGVVAEVEAAEARVFGRLSAGERVRMAQVLAGFR